MKDQTPVKEIKAEMMTANEVGLVERGEALKQACNNVGEKYLDLCRWIRSAQIAPRRVTELLLPLGFNKVRVSEVNRVAQCADELWNEFEAKKIGMKSVLLLERGGDDAKPEDVTKTEPVAEAGPEFLPKDPAEITKAKQETMAKCAKSILNAAEFLNITRAKTWTLHNGWTLVLSKDKKKPEPKGAKGAPVEAKKEDK